ncbi:hypothetical protein [Photobacterium leiognathi]|uniref:hypothetical protein n=1 Tax=Photobacterium leiognathi TaxID=553611 RepID=UPI002981C638|nr:hypothetical protein [Photobacterium leiognathi]
MQEQVAFERLVKNEFENATFDDLKRVALAIWYEGFVPTVDQLDSGSIGAACYLLDRLMRYNCVTIEEQRKLITVINELADRLPMANPDYTNLSVDKAARKWGLHRDLKLMLKMMIPFQTRHYKHTKSERFNNE